MNPMILRLFSMIIIVVLSVVRNANAENTSKLPTATEVLSKAAEAKSTVDYVGKRIVIMWRPFGSMAFEERIIHQTPSTHLVELLTPADRMLPERKPDKDDKSGGQSRWKRGERNRMRRMPPRGMRKPRDIWKNDTKLLLRNYTVNVELGEPIAGQNTYLLTINPKVDLRPRKKVWLDAQHYIILRMEDYDITERLSFLYVYTTIDYDSASVAQQLKQYQKERGSEKERRPGFNRRQPYQSKEISFAEAEEKLSVRLPQPSYLPFGFQLQSISVMNFHGKMPFRANPSIHFKYTDGLIALSLFVSKISDERGEQLHQRSREDGFRDRRLRGDRFRSKLTTIIAIRNTPISVTDGGDIRILEWNRQSERGNLRFVLIGGLSQEELVKVAEALVSQE